MKLTHGVFETNSGEGKEEKSKFKGTLAAGAILDLEFFLFGPPWIISNEEDPGHSKIVSAHPKLQTLCKHWQQIPA